MKDDMISRQAAIDALWRLDVELRPSSIDAMLNMLNGLPSSQPERTESIPETKAVRSKRDCVDLAERVSATYYDQEHEEWTQKTVTVADVLDSVCDEYTILPYVQPTIDAVPVKHGKWIRDKYNGIVNYHCSECLELCDGEYDYCPYCGARMDEE